MVTEFKDVPGSGSDGGAPDSGDIDSGEGASARVERPRLQPDSRRSRSAGTPDADQDPSAAETPADPTGVEPAAPGPQQAASIAGIRPTGMRKDDHTSTPVPADDAGDGSGAPESHPNVAAAGPRRWIPIAFGIALIGLVIAAAYLFAINRSEVDASDQRIRLLDAARQTALNLTTMHADTAEEDVERLLAGASGNFLEQFRDRQTEFVSTVGQAGVNSDGSVVDAGIESFGQGCAVTLVAADATVTNAEVDEPQARYFRFRITVCESNAVVTATDVEFVE